MNIRYYLMATVMHGIRDDAYEAVFCPGEGQRNGAKMLTVSMTNGSTYILTSGKDYSFTGGHAYTMTVRVGKDKVLIGDISVNPWIEDETSDLGSMDSELDF